MKNEYWIPIKDYEGFYEISNLSNVRSVSRGSLRGRILKPLNAHGYMHVSFSKNAVVKIFSVHRLVAYAFIPNPENKPYINHKNGIRNDNRIENLEWCTQLENVNHSVKIGLTQVAGSRNPNSRLDNISIQIIKEAYQTGNFTLADIGSYFNVSFQHISNIIKGKRWAIRDENKLL